jgi:hypothetical protein
MNIKMKARRRKNNPLGKNRKNIIIMIEVVSNKVVTNIGINDQRKLAIIMLMIDLFFIKYLN